MQNPVDRNFFLLIGTQKAGTTSVYTIFKEYESLNLARPKESTFFYTEELFGQGKSLYLNKFFDPKYPELPHLDIDPNFLFYPEVAQRIYDTLGPKVKFIAILRDPCERAYSQYLMEVARGDETLSFREAIQQEATRLSQGRKEDLNHYSYIQRGLYYKQLSRYFKLFKPENFQVFLFEEDFIEKKKDMLASICRFMHVPYQEDVKIDIKSNSRVRVKNKLYDRIFSKMKPMQGISHLIAKLPNSLRKPAQKVNGYLYTKSLAWYMKFNTSQTGIESLDPETRAYMLENYFLKDIEKLETLIQRDLSTWKDVKVLANP